MYTNTSAKRGNLALRSIHASLGLARATLRLYIYIYIYICIEREKERWIDIDIDTYIDIGLHIDIDIDIDIDIGIFPAHKASHQHPPQKVLPMSPLKLPSLNTDLYRLPTMAEPIPKSPGSQYGKGPHLRAA